MKNTQKLGLWVASLVIVCACVAHAEPTKLTLHRPYKVGETYLRTVEIDETVDATFMLNGKKDTHRQQQLRIKFVANIRVLSVNANGQPTGELMRVMTCDMAVDDGPMQAVIEPGRLVTARLVGGLTIYRPTKGILTPEGNMALRYAVNLPTAGTGTLTDHLSPGRPVSVGQTWPADVNAIAKSMRESGMIIKPGDLKATVTYTSQTQAFKGQPSDVLNVQGDVDGFAFDQQDAPPVRDGKLQFRTTLTLPVDPTSRYGKQHRVSNMRFTSIMGEGMVVNSIVDREMTSTTAPLRD